MGKSILLYSLLNTCF